jgi:hypothetical protein
LVSENIDLVSENIGFFFSDGLDLGKRTYPYYPEINAWPKTLPCGFASVLSRSSPVPLACALSVSGGDDLAVAVAAVPSPLSSGPSPATRGTPTPSLTALSLPTPSLPFLLCETELPNPSYFYLDLIWSNYKCSIHDYAANFDFFRFLQKNRVYMYTHVL